MDISLMDLNSLAKQIRMSTKDIEPKDLAAHLDYLDSEHRIELVKAQYADKRPAPTVRVRINVSTSVKGVVTTDTTLEHFGDLRDTDLDAIVEMRLQLTNKVNEVYPPPPLT